jgi:LacI family transcriptional regulator
MKQKGVTIYDIAKALDIHATYVSRALNEHPTINKDMVQLVKEKAKELNYRHNSAAANLRHGKSKILGVIVPKINQSFFSNTIAGIEDVCAKNNHSIIICQTNNSYQKEIEAVETLLQQHVDAILISLSAETKTSGHLQEIINNQVILIQFDRHDDSILSYIVANDNQIAAGKAVKHLLEQGYKRIAYIGGPEHLRIYKDRKQGFIDAIRSANIPIPYEFVSNITLEKEHAFEIAKTLLSCPNPPDAFFTASDYASLGVLKAAQSLNLKIPSELGIIGFQNEEFTEIITPSISSVNQFSFNMGMKAAQQYFNTISKSKDKKTSFNTEVISCEIVIRESSNRLADLDK